MGKHDNDFQTKNNSRTSKHDMLYSAYLIAEYRWYIKKVYDISR